MDMDGKLEWADEEENPLIVRGVSRLRKDLEALK